MIDRYTPVEFSVLWSSDTKFKTWYRIELAACLAMEQHGVIPRGTYQTIIDQKLEFWIDPNAIEEIEKTTKHDVIAFLTHIEKLASQNPKGIEAARWIHFGLTSSDLVDTAFALSLTEATDLIAKRLDNYITALSTQVQEYRTTTVIGRSHGMHAEPTSFGVILAGHLAEAKRGRQRLQAARREIAVGKISGAVGTYVHLSPEVEADTLSTLGLYPETVSTQVVARDRHAHYFATLAGIAAGIERIATSVRHWQRTEVDEAEERFSKGQKGSSAMPHKKNPILSENLCGLARVVRSTVIPAFENIALWHERDISHSSVERMIAPDATSLLAFMLERITKLVANIKVRPNNMIRNMNKNNGRQFSEAVLLALVQTGMPRQMAYEIVQRAAMESYGTDTFQTRLAGDPEVQACLPAGKLAECFDLGHALRHVGIIIDRALSMP